MDTCVIITDHKPSWIASFNFVCLLNIPNCVRKFGSVCGYWEGGGLGEKFIQVAKQNFKYFGGNWPCNLSNGIVRYYTINVLNKCEHDLHDEVDPDNMKDLMTGVHTYYASNIVYDDLCQHKPVPFVHFSNGKYGIKVGNLWMDLNLESYYGNKGGHDYFYWETSNKLHVVTGNESFRRSCIMLPFLGCPEKRQQELIRYPYTAIADDYTELDDKGSFVLKKVTINDFEL